MPRRFKHDGYYSLRLGSTKPSLWTDNPFSFADAVSCMIMPPGSRSRGCQACQRRKSRTPTCAKCEKLGIACSGPVVGPIIVAFDPSKRLQNQQRTASKTSHEEPTDNDQPLNRQTALTATHNSHGIQAISDSPTIRDVLTLKFQECLCIPHQRHDSLVLALTSLSSSSKLPTLQRAIWAVSAALNGAASNTPDLLKKAQEFYADALKALMRELFKSGHGEGLVLVRTREQRPVSVEMIAVAAVFVWYEAILPSNTTGWIAHAYGAGRLLLRRPPEDYRTGLSHQVFSDSKIHDGLLISGNCGVLTILQTPFASPTWLTVPFSLTRKTGFDRVLDYMLAIPITLTWINQMCINGLPIPLNAEAAKVGEDLRLLEDGLKKFLLLYEKEMIEAGGKGLFHDISGDRIDPSGTYHPKIRQYYSDDIAECIIHYEVCRLLIALMRAALSKPSGFTTCRSQALEHSASILSGIVFAEYTSTTRMVREHFGLVCVLMAVLVASPSETHREYVKLKIESWGGGNGLVGASPYHPIMRWTALKRIWSHSAVAPDNVEVPNNDEVAADVDVRNLQLSSDSELPLRMP